MFAPYWGQVHYESYKLATSIHIWMLINDHIYESINLPFSFFLIYVEDVPR